jgi:hypothetical protein
MIQLRGSPAVDFDWAEYELLILDYQLRLPNEDGLDWLKNLSSYPKILLHSKLLLMGCWRKILMNGSKILRNFLLDLNGNNHFHPLRTSGFALPDTCPNFL